MPSTFSSWAIVSAVPPISSSKIPRQSQVEQLHDSVAIDQQIARLDVAVHHAGLVGMLQTQRGLPDVIGGIDEIGDAASCDEFLQALSFHVLHDQEVDFRVAFRLMIDVVGPNDVRMVQGRHRLGFAMKPRQDRTNRRRGASAAP